MKSNIPLLPKIIFLSVVALFLFTSCGNNFKKIIGKTYIYEDSIFTFTAGMDKDTLYYIMKDSLRPYFHRSKYTYKKVDDSTFEIKVEKRPMFWDKDTWEIVVMKNGEFYSKESKKKYRLYADSMLIIEGFK
jgi:hypothetical protein